MAAFPFAIQPLSILCSWKWRHHPLIVGIFEILQEIGYIIAQHVINSLYHFGFQLLKFVDIVTTQDLPEVVDVWEISGRQVELPLDLV